MEHLRRRTFLAVAAVAATAGCIDDFDDAETQEPQEDAAENGSENETEAESDENGEEEEEEENEIETESTDEEDVESESDDEGDEDDGVEESEEADEKIMNAQDIVGNATELYASYAGVEDPITKVDCTVQINHATVQQTVDEARDELDAAREDASDDQLATIEALESAVDYIDIAAVCQRHVNNAYSTVEAALDDIYAKRPDRATTDGLGDSLDSASAQLDDLEQVNLQEMDHVDALDQDTCEEKIEQFSGEIETLDAYDSVLDGALDTLQTFYDHVVPALAEDDYEDMSEDAEQVRDGSESHASEFEHELGETPSHLKDGAHGLKCHLEAVSESAEELRLAGFRSRAGQEEEQREHEENAEEALQECDPGVVIP